ncbi:TetR/AcrR family transcriptional regulator [Actinocorallia sp. A-T 12471]|uniref:TetR/AcrR family transcriptional regulator n=1 Tax=Actinocorallia sp. A-T 12471 TaxID=3089813 RepID=UPI0029CB268A|nr:TetR/AcrR family transcriptional regulator [Actinocorallia sp. A-T 12471]MDX6743635.1 TetR/AcrR family transcriptional regulator [Actinocorallia sp. A-T 12471]
MSVTQTTAPEGAPPPKRKRMSRANRERQMLAVAEEVFAERGFRAASMEEIAERCGVSKPMLYEYFGSKDGLLLACLSRARAELHEVTAAAMAEGVDPLDTLHRGLVAYYAFTDSHGDSFRILQHEAVGLPHAAVEAVEATRRQQHALIAPIMAQWAPHLPEIAIEAYTEIIIGACERISLWFTTRPDVTPELAAHYTLEFCWLGLQGLYDREDGPPKGWEPVTEG